MKRIAEVHKELQLEESKARAKAAEDKLQATEDELNSWLVRVDDLRAQLVSMDATLASLRELVIAWREREQRLCRQADGQGQTYYAERLAAKADGVGTCADELDAALQRSRHD
jgi:septal ring factor EnvC (AmiA/AmiB activator)